MSFLDRLFGNDQQRAAKYEGRESASQSAARKRREGHRRNVPRTARKAQAREDKFWRDL